jgi:CspA family cold shock protein
MADNSPNHNCEHNSTDAQDISADCVVARLKWFNPAKGFGFLVPEDNPVDAFVHVTVLQQAGLTALGEGAVVKCLLSSGPRGHQVTEITEVLEPGIPYGRSSRTISAQEERLPGIVKWYKPDKGFGFIIPADGRKDVFVHKSCLERAGLDGLNTGVRVTVTYKEVDKGREAISLALDDDQDAF